MVFLCVCLLFGRTNAVFPCLQIGSGEDVDLLLTKLLSIREEPLPGQNHCSHVQSLYSNIEHCRTFPRFCEFAFAAARFMSQAYKMSSYRGAPVPFQTLSRRGLPLSRGACVTNHMYVNASPTLPIRTHEVCFLVTACTIILPLLTFVSPRGNLGTMEVLPIADGEAIPTSGLGTFDITVANILAGPIVRLQPVFANLTKPGEARRW